MAPRPPRPSHDPLAGIDRLLVDANNLLGSLSRGRAPLPPAALIGRIRGAIPREIDVELVFDGPPDGAIGKGRRVASGVVVRYAGGRSADAMLRAILDAAGPLAPGYEPTTLVVTDDAELRRSLRARGGATAGTSWLIERLGRTRLEGPSVGNARPPKPVPGAAGSTGGETSADGGDGGWRPGRGATRKTGNPRRAPRRRGDRTGRMPP